MRFNYVNLNLFFFFFFLLKTAKTSIINNLYQLIILYMGCHRIISHEPIFGVTRLLMAYIYIYIYICHKSRISFFLEFGGSGEGLDTYPTIQGSHPAVKGPRPNHCYISTWTPDINYYFMHQTAKCCFPLKHESSILTSEFVLGALPQYELGIFYRC